MSKLLDPWTSGQQRHVAYISEFTKDIKHVQGKHNHVADALSRATTDFIHEGVDYEEMTANQKVDLEVQVYHTASFSLQLADIPFGDKDTTILCDTVITLKIDKPVLEN